MGAVPGVFVSGLEIRLPGNRDSREQEDRFDYGRFLRGKAQHLVLARPFGWQIAKTDHAHAVRQPTFASTDQFGENASPGDTVSKTLRTNE